MKTIAIFSAFYPPHVGGVESYVFYLSKELERTGYRVIIVTSNEEKIQSVEDEGNIRIIRLPIFKTFSQRFPLPKKNKEFKQLMSLLDSESIEHIIVNTRFHLTSMVGAKYGYDHHIKVSLIEHGSNHLTVDHKLFDLLGEQVEHALTWRIKKYVSDYYGVSRAASKWIEHFKVKSSGEWYNSIDVNQEIPVREKQSLFTFSYAGRIIKQKGIENVLEAYSKLQTEYPNMQLLIAGEGNQKEELEKKYKENKSIHFLGRIEKKEVLNLLAKSDVFLYPPIWPEGLPSSILEAGLLKTPVITTAQGGITEIIEDRSNGILVKEDSESLYQAMKELLLHEDLRAKLGDSLHRTVEDKFSWQSTANKVIIDISK